MDYDNLIQTLTTDIFNTLTLSPLTKQQINDILDNIKIQVNNIPTHKIKEK